MRTFSVLVVYGVCLSYFVYLVRLVRRRQFNLLDFFFHSLICVVPPLYISFFEPISAALAFLGIQTPFLVLFGSFLVILFLYISRIVMLLHAQEKRQTRLIEELALLSYEKQRERDG